MRDNKTGQVIDGSRTEKQFIHFLKFATYIPLPLLSDPPTSPQPLSLFLLSLPPLTIHTHVKYTGRSWVPPCGEYQALTVPFPPFPPSLPSLSLPSPPPPSLPLPPSLFLFFDSLSIYDMQDFNKTEGITSFLDMAKDEAILMEPQVKLY